MPVPITIENIPLGHYVFRLLDGYEGVQRKKYDITLLEATLARSRDMTRKVRETVREAGDDTKPRSLDVLNALLAKRIQEAKDVVKGVQTSIDDIAKLLEQEYCTKHRGKIEYSIDASQAFNTLLEIQGRIIYRHKLLHNELRKLENVEEKLADLRQRYEPTVKIPRNITTSTSKTKLNGVAIRIISFEAFETIRYYTKRLHRGKKTLEDSIHRANPLLAIPLEDSWKYQGIHGSYDACVREHTANINELIANIDRPYTAIDAQQQQLKDRLDKAVRNRSRMRADRQHAYAQLRTVSRMLHEELASVNETRHEAYDVRNRLENKLRGGWQS